MDKRKVQEYELFEKLKKWKQIKSLCTTFRSYDFNIPFASWASE